LYLMAFLWFQPQLIALHEMDDTYAVLAS